MIRPRVFWIGVNRLVGEGVNALLSREGIDPVGFETDPRAALERVRALAPDIVLVEDDGDGAETLSEENTAVRDFLAQLVREKGNLRVIRLCLRDGQLYVFQQEQRQLASTHDLVAAICGLAPPAGGNGNTSQVMQEIENINDKEGKLWRDVFPEDNS